MAEQLTPAQRQVVENRGGPLLVSAAAGSGKTKVLVDRLLSYIGDPQDSANIDDFLIITYTKAAAAELRGKIAAKLTQELALEPENRHLQRQLQRLYLAKISTVHSFCSDILKEYAYKLQLSADFRMIDESESQQLRSMVMAQILEEAYAAAGEDPAFCAFIDTQGLGRNDGSVPQIIEQVYDKSRCHLRPAEYLQACLQLTQTGEMTDAVETVYGRKMIRQLHDYLDLQLEALAGAVELTSEPGMEKPRTLLLETIEQLRTLRAATTWEQVIAAKDIQYGTLRFPKGLSDSENAARIKAIRDACKKGVTRQLRGFTDPSATVLQDLSETTLALRGLISLVDQFGKAYEKAKKRRHCLDFSDLEHLTLDLLLGTSRSGLTGVAREIGRRFREVLVDEYQDSNAVQDAIFTALTQEKKNCFMVGDVKQSIYQFRLADPEIFLEKYQNYAPAQEAEAGQGRKILLSHNFRSGGAVLDAANDVFRLCMSDAVGGLVYGEEEALREGLPHIPLGEPEVKLAAIEVQDDTYAEEAAYVADRIEQLLQGEHYIRQGEQLRRIRPEDIAILLRSPNSVGQYYLDALERRGIRCNTGKQADLFRSSEISTLSSLLEVIDNPRQDIPLIAALASPVFGFTADELARIRCSSDGSYFDALQSDGGDRAARFLMQLEHLRSVARMESICALLEEIFVITRLDSIYAAMANGEERLENLYTFFRIASDGESAGRRTLSSFLEHLHGLQEQGLPGTDEAAAGAVQLLSIHKSKGLEYPVVFLCGLSRAFNKESQREAVLCHRELGLGLSAIDRENRVRYPTIAKRAIAQEIGDQSLSEEMRVLYVAMTRARDRLIMTYASDSLEEQISDLLLRMDATPTELLCRDVSNPGTWILLAALQRTEAGELFALAGCQHAGMVSEHPWRITVETAGESAQPNTVEFQATAAEENINYLDILRQIIGFQYPHREATVTASKRTATELKGREKDKEAAEEAALSNKGVHTFRTPGFAGGAAPYRGIEYGNAMHKAMASIRFAACTDEANIAEELNRLTDEGCFTAQERALIDPHAIARFFRSDIGKRLQAGGPVLREFKFSILQDIENLPQEQVLLQGVVDCALIEPDGLVLLDFKTDYVTADNLQDKVGFYTPQVSTYAGALERIYNLPVKEKYLYFFHSGELIPV